MTLSASTQAKLLKIGPAKFGSGRCSQCDTEFANEWYFGETKRATEARHLREGYLTPMEFAELMDFLRSQPTA